MAKTAVDFSVQQVDAHNRLMIEQ